MADRRGILSDGRRLSPIQVAALDLLMSLDDKDQKESFVEDFKLQLVGSDPTFWATRLYPEFFSEKDDSTYDIDAKNVEWVMPEMTEEQMQDLLDEMMAKDPSAMTFGEYEEQQEDW